MSFMLTLLLWGKGKGRLASYLILFPLMQVPGHSALLQYLSIEDIVAFLNLTLSLLRYFSALTHLSGDRLLD